ncbi:serine acetyltransferase [Pseudoalteromonas lipolytica]|uniref:Serine acetyltransferase n=1 Tax=Pseudoalteromonas lipolytica TaxID=570156 RepID=A0AAD0WDI8_9GAMM|nr:serine O-acetyltransferase [Pseudoalteromonas donghaensis]AXV66458.1 serine acetyltransferase [Pseudoalteromonas donghaensis]
MNPIRLYRFGNYLYKNKMYLLSKLVTLVSRFVFTAYIPSSCRIGQGIVLGYGGMGIVLHSQVSIGNNCHISQHVTIGGTSKKLNVPTLGNDVYVGAGAKILGDITIGDNVVIGANSVVVKSIPPNSLVVGIPGRVIKTGIEKKDYV